MKELQKAVADESYCLKMLRRPLTALHSLYVLASRTLSSEELAGAQDAEPGIARRRDKVVKYRIVRPNNLKWDLKKQI